MSTNAILEDIYFLSVGGILTDRRDNFFPFERLCRYMDRRQTQTYTDHPSLAARDIRQGTLSYKKRTIPPNIYLTNDPTHTKNVATTLRKGQINLRCGAERNITESPWKENAMHGWPTQRRRPSAGHALRQTDFDSANVSGTDTSNRWRISAADDTSSHREEESHGERGARGPVALLDLVLSPGISDCGGRHENDCAIAI